jgi:transcription elongation factor GreB
VAYLPLDVARILTAHGVMSRAFVKEPDGDSAPPDLPDLPISPHPNYVTPAGLEKLRARHRELMVKHRELKTSGDPADRGQLALAERDLRYLEARLGSAILRLPGVESDGEVQFGATVTVEDAHGKKQRYRIVGEDEADADSGLISHVSPLAKALLGAAIDDEVIWRRPVGDLALTILAIGED